jgi:zinc/manganese transport system substrate-binding protein
MKARPVRAVLAAALACALTIASAQAADKVKVLASFSIIGDLVKQVGGERVDVDLLVGPDADMHNFQPSPADSRKLAGAKLIVVNGLGLEGWADRLIKAAGYRGPQAVASQGIKPLAKEPGDKHGHGHGHGRSDPHAWQDVRNVKVYVVNIRNALIAADSANEAAYRQNADAYLAKLDALDREIKAALADLPKERRRVITTHEAFNYFSAAYDVEFFAAKGVRSDAEPSARDIARLIQRIRKENVAAMFFENLAGERLLERIVQETGAKVGGTLYSDALSPPGGPAATYVDMMRHNARTIAQALRGAGGR